MYRLSKTLIFVLIAAACATAQQQKSSRPAAVSSAFLFPAGFISYSARDGYRKYEDLGTSEHIDRKNLLMYGFSGGKRFRFKNQRLRIQSTLEFGWGSVTDDVYEDVPLNDGSSIDILMNDNLFTFGMNNDLQILFPSKGKLFYFLSAGPGFGWSSFKRAGKTDDGYQLMEDEITDNIWFGLNVGAGLDWVLNRRRALSISYNFRIWRPVSYDNLLLFPMGTEYKEHFYTHTVQAHLLILPHRGKFR